MMYLKFVEVKPTNLPDMGAIRAEKTIKDMDGNMRECYLISWADSKGLGVRLGYFDKEDGEYICEETF